jgi:hypothetical protein
MVRSTWLALGTALSALGGGACSSGGTPLEPSDPPECTPITAPSTWAAWIMPNPVTSGLPNPASYEPSASGNRVTDRVTGLVWQRHVDDRTFTWEGAKQYCSCLVVDGTDGWRLPSRIELVSLVDWTLTNPSIDSRAFPETSNENFWAASAVTINPGLAYLSYFSNGHTTYGDFAYEYRARCVQAKEAAVGEHYVSGDGSVHDTRTQLTWQQPFPSERYTWDDASRYCASLSLPGAGWRLPSINELQTLVDDSVNPSIDRATFPGTPSEYFWSSSPVIDDATRAWTTFFTNGSTYSFDKTAAKNVRCVR